MRREASRTARNQGVVATILLIAQLQCNDVRGMASAVGS